MVGLAEKRGRIKRRAFHRLYCQVAQPELVALRKLSEATGLSIAEHVRRAVDGYLAGERAGNGRDGDQNRERAARA